MLPRLERFFFALLQRDRRSSRVHSAELHAAAMATLETAQGRTGRPDARPFTAPAQPAYPIRDHLLRTGLHANAVGDLLARVIGNGTGGPSQGADQDSTVRK